MRQTLLMFDDFFQVVFASDSERSVRDWFVCRLERESKYREGFSGCNGHIWKCDRWRGIKGPHPTPEMIRLRDLWDPRWFLEILY